MKLTLPPLAALFCLPAAEFPELQDEWRGLQHKVHKLNREIQRFQAKPNVPSAGGDPLSPRPRFLLEPAVAVADGAGAGDVVTSVKVEETEQVEVEFVEA